MKTLSLFAVAAIIFMVSNPKLCAKNSPQFGMRAGYLSSNIYVDQIDNFSERRSGFSIGVYSRINAAKNFSVILQLDYLQKGFNEIQYETNNDGKLIQTVKANTRLDYLSLPMLIEFSLDATSMKPYLAAGPRFDILIGKFNGVWNFSYTNFESRFADNLDGYSFGWRMASGFHFGNIAKRNLGLEFYYDTDFSNASKNSNWSIKGNNFGVAITIQ